MTTLEEIVASAEQLPLKQFLELRKKLDRLEEKLWNAESRAAAAELEATGLTDAEIDRRVLRRRRESRR